MSETYKPSVNFMKAAILTKYYKNYNYGGMLQGYALHKTIEEMGVNCDIISYDVGRNPNPIYKNVAEQCKQYGFTSAVKKVSEKVIGRCGFLIKDVLSERRALFDNFEAETGADTSVYDDNNIKELNDKYDIFIAGSDQIWNPNAVRKLFLLGYINDDKVKTSYAASFGRDSLSEHEMDVMFPLIQRLDYISVREETGRSLLSGHMDGKNIEVVLDPTMLVSKDDWESAAAKRQYNNDYALFYFFSDSTKVRNKTQKYFKDRELASVFIPYAKQEFNVCDSRGAGNKLNKVGPREFLSSILYADYVVTDSFHGAVFSLIFQKEFIVLERNKKERVSMNSRLYDLMKMFGLEERIISVNDLDKIDKLSKIDYERVSTILEKKKAESMTLLSDILSNKKREIRNENTDYFSGEIPSPCSKRGCSLYFSPEPGKRQLCK